ncbi:MAG: zinc ribbon domain-containing protein [Hyphomicrobiales bacterium]
MPTYDYRCTGCGEQHRLQHSMSADKPDCPACGGALEQIFITAPAIAGATSGTSAAEFASCGVPGGGCATGTCPFQ